MKNPFRHGKHERRGKHAEGNPAHVAKDCPKDASKAARRSGKQGLTHYTCNDCGTVWSTSPPPLIDPPK